MMLEQYLLVLVPGLALATVLFLSLRRAHPVWHLFLFVTVFLFTRDAMTPRGLWSIGNEGFLWLRFVADPVALVLLGFGSIAFVILMQAASPELAARVTWFEGNRLHGVLVGIGGAVVAALPLLLVYLFGVGIEHRGGAVALAHLPFVLFVALSGNLYEEVLFRGYVYGWLTGREGMAPVAAALVSGVFFSFGHVFLAFNVTDVGVGLLVFALWEGCLAGLVRSRFGVVPAVLTHGLAVFLLTSGWV